MGCLVCHSSIPTAPQANNGPPTTKELKIHTIIRVEKQQVPKADTTDAIATRKIEIVAARAAKGIPANFGHGSKQVEVAIPTHFTSDCPVKETAAAPAIVHRAAKAIKPRKAIEKHKTKRGHAKQLSAILESLPKTPDTDGLEAHIFSVLDRVYVPQSVYDVLGIACEIATVSLPDNASDREKAQRAGQVSKRLLEILQPNISVGLYERSMSYSEKQMFFLDLLVQYWSKAHACFQTICCPVDDD